MTSTRGAMTLLRSADPVAPMGALDDVPVIRQPYARTPRRRSRLALVLAGAAAVGVVALGLGVVPLPWTHGTASPAAAAALDRAASAADITARDEVARPDQYWRITSRGQSICYCGEGTVLLAGTSTTYVPVDGSRPSWWTSSGSRVVRVLTGSRPSTDQLDTPETATDNLTPNDIPGTWQQPNPAWLAALPRDTRDLRDRLYDDTSGHGLSHDGEVLVYVADVLRSGTVPADLRAALFRVLETVPGVDIVKRHEDGLISIGRLEDKDGQRQEIVIDPATGDYVGERTLQVRALDGVPAGTVIGEVTVSRTLVDSVPQRVQTAAVHQVCTASPDGAVMCSGG